jgi:hypothetical protein
LAEFTHDDPELAKLPPPTTVESISRDKLNGFLLRQMKNILTIKPVL